MMTYLRLIVTAILSILVTGIGFPFIFVVGLLLFPVRHQVALFLARIYCGVILKIFRVTITGDTGADLPANHQGIIIVANHASFLDVLLLNYLFNATFVSKQSILYWPIIGQVGWLTGNIFLKRNSIAARLSLVKRLAYTIRKNQVIGIFPQGTTGKITDKVPFHRGIFKVVELNPQIRILPVSIRYLQDEQVSWGSETFLTNALALCRLKRIEVKITTHPVFPSSTQPQMEAKRAAIHIQETVFSGLVTP